MCLLCCIYYLISLRKNIFSESFLYSCQKQEKIKIKIRQFILFQKKKTVYLSISALFHRVPFPCCSIVRNKDIRIWLLTANEELNLPHYNGWLLPLQHFRKWYWNQFINIYIYTHILTEKKRKVLINILSMIRAKFDFFLNHGYVPKRITGLNLNLKWFVFFRFNKSTPISTYFQSHYLQIKIKKIFYNVINSFEKSL